MQPSQAAIVTGGSGAIGRAISLRLARDGFFVYVCCRSNREAADTLVDQIRTEGGGGEVLHFDVSDAQAAEEALTPLAGKGLPLGAVVHAAGVLQRSLMIQTTPKSWAETVEANLNGFFYVVRPVLRGMIRARQGSFVAISSIVAECGLEGQAAYAASKAGLVGAIRSLAREAGPYHIRANIVSPGWISAGMNVGEPPDAVRSRIPLRRGGTAEEVADAVSFLCSPRAAYVTGAVLPVSGGLDM